jgi:hypothetical protein
MSKLAHSDEAGMAELERRAAIEAGELYRCLVCGAENFVDQPDCPRGGVHCVIVQLEPTWPVARD